MFYLKNLESERLRYRPLQLEDIDIWKAFLSDPESTKFFPKLELTPAQRSHSWVSSQLERYCQGLHGMCAMINKETGEFIGQCGLLSQEVNGIPEIEIGYHLMPDQRGKGYATEGAQHMKAAGFEMNIADSIISIIAEENYPSQAVAKRNGMKEDFRTKWKNLDVIIFRTYATS